MTSTDQDGQADPLHDPALEVLQDEEAACQTYRTNARLEAMDPDEQVQAVDRFRTAYRGAKAFVAEADRRERHYVVSAVIKHEGAYVLAVHPTEHEAQVAAELAYDSHPLAAYIEVRKFTGAEREPVLVLLRTRGGVVRYTDGIPTLAPGWSFDASDLVPEEDVDHPDLALNLPYEDALDVVVDGLTNEAEMQPVTGNSREYIAHVASALLGLLIDASDEMQEGR